jgi:hypothetical protein
MPHRRSGHLDLVDVFFSLLLLQEAKFEAKWPEACRQLMQPPIGRGEAPASRDEPSPPPKPSSSSVDFPYASRFNARIFMSVSSGVVTIQGLVRIL